ncbi:hypothetical protein EDI_000820 [Entamoeba dispar SAW760]|uniref:Uncharacterized protein n=1 Tax=Entamoeba dispar (strain ATCC PRA-260 / SAW760) TaxID=370354 RepID=B0EEJ7_ENTDS|nr:uncharacterized protein EDI_000820 [Entamoeba dispar SAW760]EDR27057.1 hypothetical protein EDI_000820 [Entamoeba dispar SAW760]|eukprot:EDR27057.1 hypothetical protein EDI_000820 [Entamoeba dispar SAW760]
MAEEKKYPIIYRKTYCGFALSNAFDSFETNNTSAVLSTDLREQFNVEFDRAFIETFQNHVQSTTHIKGSGYYKSTDGEFWEFTIKNPEIKTDNENIQPKLLQIYSAASQENKKGSKKKK